MKTKANLNIRDEGGQRRAGSCRRRRPSSAKWCAVRRIVATDESLLYLSLLTLGEIRKGIVALVDAARRVRLEAWLLTVSKLTVMT
jgi:hypothetical protein